MLPKGRPVHLTVRALLPMVSGLDQLGLRPQPLLEAAGIPEKVLTDPDAKVPAGSVAALWDLALDASRDPCLGIHLAEAAELKSFEVHAYALLSSHSLREAYRRASRYQRLIHETTELTLDEGPEDGTLLHSLPGGRSVGRQPAEFLATAWVRIGRLVTGQQWTPGAVYFAHAAPESTTEHDCVFQERRSIFAPVGPRCGSATPFSMNTASHPDSGQACGLRLGRSPQPQRHPRRSRPRGTPGRPTERRVWRGPCRAEAEHERAQR